MQYEVNSTKKMKIVEWNNLLHAGEIKPFGSVAVFFL